MTAEPLTPEEEAELRADIALEPEGRAEQVYGEDVLRLLATLDAARKASPPLDVERLRRDIEVVTGTVYHSADPAADAAWRRIRAALDPTP